MNTVMYTAESVRTSAGVVGNAILVESGNVVAVGDRKDLGAGSIVEYPGAFLLPGLRDAHIHPVGYAAALRGATLASAANLADIGRRLRETALTTAEDSLVLGIRLNEETLAERRLPDRADLDAAVADQPVLAHRYCGHVAVANSIALDLAGVHANTPDPSGGVIDRDESGRPTGVLRETAIELVAGSFGTGNQVTPAELLAALRRLAAAGITSIGAILRTGGGTWAYLGNEFEIAVAASEQMPIKVGAYLIETDPAKVAASKALIEASGPRLRWLGIKRFGDGSFGGHTAAMYERFVDVDTTGTMRLTDLDRRITEASLAVGGGAAIHAIGDHACGAVLDMFGELIAAGARPGKLRVEHASVLTAPDILRFGELGVIAVVQPPFIGSEAMWLPARLGADRISRTYPFAAMEDAGVVLAGSSDSPVESPDPWAGMALAQDRLGLADEQSISAARALAMYTTGAAVALEEPEPLSVGSPADFILVDHDPVAVSPDGLRNTEVIATFVDGTEIDVDRSQPLWLD